MIATDEKRRVGISVERQITIPQNFYKLFNFKSEAEFSVVDGNLVLKPVPTAENQALNSEREFLDGLNGGSGRPIIGLARGKLPKLERINVLDDEVAHDFEDFV